MIKKLASFLYCLVPMCAFATDNQTFPGVDGELTEVNAPLNLIDNNAVYIFEHGSGIKISGSLRVDGAVYVGYNAVMPYVPSSIYAEVTDEDRTDYLIQTDGLVSIGGLLDVAQGYTLTIGNISYNFSAGVVDIYGGLDLYGAALSFGEFAAHGSGNVNISGTSLTLGANPFQAWDDKNVTVELTGAFNAGEYSIENKATGTMSITAGAITASNITNESNSGAMNIKATSLNLTGGDTDTTASFINKGDFIGEISGATTLAHGFDLSSMGATNVFSLTTGTLSLGDRIDAFFDNNLNSFTVNVTSGALNANTIRNGAENANANMTLSATAIDATGIVASGGVMNLSAPTISVDTGGITVDGNGRMNLSNVNSITSGGAVSIAGNLGVGAASASNGGMNITNGFTSINANGFDVTVGGGMSANGLGNGVGITAQTISVANDVISSNNGEIVFNAETVSVGGDLGGDSVGIYNPGVAEGINVTIGGSILGGTDIIGLGHMMVGENYLFDRESQLVAFVNQESSTYSYWADAAFDEENMIVNIVNNLGTAAEPLISVSGHLITDVVSVSSVDGSPLLDSEIGINLLSDVSVTGGSAIWLMHADEGLQVLGAQIARLSINFCDVTATGMVCFDYLSATDPRNDAGETLPIYLASYDTDGDGVTDSLYVVFDEQFADPVRMFKLQPIVASAPYYTRGEYQSAGALDDLIEYELLSHGFSYNSPLVVAKVLFDGTPLYRVGNELYERMYDYAGRVDPNVIRAFSRVFQLREANQIVDALELNTHTLFKDLSNRFIDEAIWNRNRRLNKAWVIADYGYFIDDLVDNHAHGSRMGLTFGYDWQLSKTLILGWMGHVGHTRGKDNDVIDLSYDTTRAIGNVDTDVQNLDISGGMYFMKTLNNKARWYGDAMLGLNLVDVARDQIWIDNRIEGDATSYSLIGETGLIHDLLNQYFIGNLYLRLGYNSGFDMTEKVGGVDYMNLDFDGHFILTPGYSVTAQKRFYPSTWFQIRPYATIGVEYDLVGTPDTMKYKFAVVSPWRDYDIGVDPLWAHIGAGAEFLWVNGIHVGIDYRYQYNDNVQMHKVHLSGMYRF